MIPPTPLPTVAGDPSDLQEALTNLVLNALDAMPEGVDFFVAKPFKFEEIAGVVARALTPEDPGTPLLRGAENKVDFSHPSY